MIPFPLYKEPVIEVIEDLSVLSDIKDEFAWDIETNSIKSSSKEAEIISYAIADTADHAYVFLAPTDFMNIAILKHLLKNPKIGKYGWNIKFETNWAQDKLGIEVKNWVWDGMITSHVLDNREGITSLKIQTLLNLGIYDYSSAIEPYLKSSDDSRGSNSINNIKELFNVPGGVEMLLKYNAYDAINTYRIDKMQMNEIILPF
jgi:DNA polymerase I-like protein with 3'-5' exonuclease and polymerase domains